MPKYTRIAGLVTCKFKDEIDLIKADEFIKTWLGYAIVVCINSCPLKIKDRHLILSSALEGVADAFTYLFLIRSNEEWGEGLKRKSISLSCKRCLYHQMVYFGFIPDKKRKFFPKETVSWEDFFKNFVITEEKFYKFDLLMLIKNKIFTETEVKIIELYVQGYSPIEISHLTGYGKRWIHQSLSRLENKLKDQEEIKYKRKFKYGAIGPYKKRNL